VSSSPRRTPEGTVEAALRMVGLEVGARDLARLARGVDGQLDALRSIEEDGPAEEAMVTVFDPRWK